MSKSLDKESYHTRWSEPILRGRYSIYSAPTTEEEVSSARRSRSSSPLLISHQAYAGRLEPCCTCHNRRDRKKPSKIYSSATHAVNESKKSYGTSKAQRIRESLELQLIGTQVEEALAGDRQSTLIQQLDLATNTLEALIQHVQSLQVSHRSAYRVLDFSHQLVLPCSTSPSFDRSLIGNLVESIRQAEILKESRLQCLKGIMDICTKNVTASDRLQMIIDKHRVRRNDFSTAVKNFKNLLDNSKLSTSRMEKLHKQYESILVEYQESSRALDVELPKIVKTRLIAIGQSFRLINEFYNDCDYSKETGNMFKLMSENLYQKQSGITNTENRSQCTNNNMSTIVDRVSYKDMQQEPLEICKKCKVNQLDKH